MEKYLSWKTWENLLGWEKFVNGYRSPLGLLMRGLGLLVWVVGMILQNLWVTLAAALIYFLGGFAPRPYRPVPWVEKFVQSGFLRLENVICQLLAFAVYSAGFWLHRQGWILLGVFIAGLGVVFFRKE